MLESIIAALVGVIGITIFLFLFVGALALLRAFVLIKLWGWFMIPLMAQFIDTPPHLNYPIAIGLSIIAGMFQSTTTKQEDSLKVILVPILAPLITLLMGWIVHLFM